jgi:hypothetical protein
MKKSQLLKIIRESIKELQNKKTLLTEACTAFGPQITNVECSCEGTGQGGSCGGLQTYERYTNCNVSISMDCSCCIGMIDPRGGGRAPMGTTIR